MRLANEINQLRTLALKIEGRSASEEYRQKFIEIARKASS